MLFTDEMKISTYIWITGASSGIGEALALNWAKAGTCLILSGRNIQQLESVAAICRLKNAEVSILAFDLTKKEEVDSAVEKVIALVPRIDVLVNNGGISHAPPPCGPSRARPASR